MVYINKLLKKYITSDGEITALDNVTLHIKPGEFTAIVGKSGSGKTTLLNMIAGLDIPDSGSIIFEGTDIVKLSSRRTAMLRRRKIGVIYQFYNLIPELNIKENIFLPTELEQGRNPNAADNARLAEILETVGLAGRENAYPNTLSGGQQQRVAIARAIFGTPSLILADEPTGNLDSENSEGVLRLLSDLNEKQGVTILVVTHSDAVARCAKRIITLSGGKVIGDIKQTL